MRGSTIRRAIAAAVVTAVALAVVSLPATASKGGGKHRAAPQIESTAFSTGENQSTVVEAGVVRASKVTLTVGKGKDSQRFKLARTDRAEGTTYWTTEVPDREKKCAPVAFVAQSSAGTDERLSRVCTFGMSEPEPPSITPDLGP